MKRVLIVGAGIIEKQNAAGITLKSIFSEFDSKSLMGLDWGSVEDSANQTLMPIRHLTFSFFSFGRLLTKDCFKKISHRMKKEEAPSAVSKERTHDPSNWRIFVKRLRQWIALLPASSKVHLSKEDVARIKAFAPQVIYTVGETVTALRLAYVISKKLEIPIVIHFMDNWKHSVEWASNPLLKGYQRRLSKYCDLCCSRSTNCITIGDRMAEIYQQETGIPHSVIMNSVDVSAFSCESRESDGTLRFVYAGGLHLGREQALRAIGECIDCICEETGSQADFSIYTSSENIETHSEQFSHLKNTRICNAVPHEQIIEVYKQSDILVHVESSELESNEFFKYSVSTKISEYLATGRTILFFGPKNISLFGFLAQNKLAYTVSDDHELTEVISAMFNGMKNEFSQNARKYAEKHFDISVARKRFEAVIDSVDLPDSTK